jgi:hypothetical protein
MEPSASSAEQLPIIAKVVFDQFTPNELALLKECPGTDNGSSLYAWRYAQLLLGDFGPESLHFLANTSFLGFHMPISAEKTEMFPHFSSSRLRVISRLYAIVAPGPTCAPAIELYARLVEALKEDRDTLSINQNDVSDLIALDLGCSVYLYRAALGLGVSHSEDLLCAVLEGLDRALISGNVQVDGSIWLNAKPEPTISNLICLLLDIRLMQGDWDGNDNLRKFIESIETNLPSVNRAGIRSHATRIGLVCDITSKLNLAIGQTEENRRRLVINIPAWGKDYLDQTLSFGMRQLISSWNNYKKGFWKSMTIVVICGEEDISTFRKNLAQKLGDISDDIKIEAVSVKQDFLGLSKNFLMPTLTMGAILSCKNLNSDIFLAAADSIFGAHFLQSLDDLIDRRKFSVIFEPGLNYTEDIFINKNNPVLPNIEKWENYIAPLIKSYELSFIDKTHNTKNASKFYNYDSFHMYYMNSPNCPFITRETMFQLILPHWYTLDCWFNELLVHLGVINEKECFVTEHTDFPAGAIAADLDGWAADEQYISLFSDLNSGPDFFQLFRTTRKAHKFTPTHCRAGTVACKIGLPSAADFAKWQLEDAVYRLATELVEIEAEDRTFWGVPYPDAIAAARHHALTKKQAAEY